MANTEQLAEARTKAAQSNRRKKEERLAQELRDRGWVTHSPYDAPALCPESWEARAGEGWAIAPPAGYSPEARSAVAA